MSGRKPKRNTKRNTKDDLVEQIVDSSKSSAHLTLLALKEEAFHFVVNLINDPPSGLSKSQVASLVYLSKRCGHYEAEITSFNTSKALVSDFDRKEREKNQISMIL